MGYDMNQNDNYEGFSSIEIYDDDKNKVTKYRWNEGSASRVVIGLLLLFAAAALILSRVTVFNNLFHGISIWAILLTIFLLICFFNGVKSRDFGAMLIPLAFIVIVNAKVLHLEAITPWPVLGAAVLGTFGLNIMFPKRHHGMHISRNGIGEEAHVDDTTMEGDKLYYRNSFGSSVKYLSGEVSSVVIEASFGEFTAYFTDVFLKNNTANLVISSSFGESTLVIPRDWKVVVNVSSGFGDVNESGSSNPNGTNVLYIKGSVSFGALNIQYV